MKRIILTLIGCLSSFFLFSQNSSVHSRILTRFEQWKTARINAGAYVSAGNCRADIVTRSGYKGAMTGIPDEITIHYADINQDGKLDALVTFNPVQCDGGNALMNAQDRVLILSGGTAWTTDEKYIAAIESKKDGWLSVEGTREGTIFGTYYEYGPDDARCCPGIKKSFTIDYKTKKLTIEK